MTPALSRDRRRESPPPRSCLCRSSAVLRQPGASVALTGSFLSRSELRHIAFDMKRPLLAAFSAAAACLLGFVASQTTVSPAVTNTTAGENATVTLLPSAVPLDCSTVNTSACAACASGSYADNDTLQCSCCSDPGLCVTQGACLLCAKGQFQPLAGQTRCVPCARGSFSNVTGSLVCQVCPPGSYSNQSGSDSCTSCSPGFYASQRNASSCDPCSLGTFCNSSRCAQCPVCPPGMESLHIAAKECTLCRPGMHKGPDQGLCQICKSGYFQIRWGQEICEICPENNYCPSPDLNPIQCPSDAFCPQGSTAPGYCMETFFRKSGDTCQLAPVTIALLVVAGGMVLLCAILLGIRRRRRADGELSVSRAPLLRKERSSSRFYGAEPVYAGW
nr:scavenger receptor class F member 1-like [Paramormyrops kingsleyae]